MYPKFLKTFAILLIMNIPKLPLRARARSFVKPPKRGSISARDENVGNKLSRAKSVMSSKQRQSQPPLSARSNSSSSNTRPVQLQQQQQQTIAEKPHTPTGRPDQRRMLSARVRDDLSNPVPLAPSSPTKHGWGLVRERVVYQKQNQNQNQNQKQQSSKMPRTNGFAPARRSSSVTLSDQVKRGATEVVQLKDEVSRLRTELDEKDQRLASAQKKVKKKLKSTNMHVATAIEKIYVRDEDAIRSAEHERNVAHAEFKVLQTRFNTIKQRNENNEKMLKERIQKISVFEKDAARKKQLQVSEFQKIQNEHQKQMEQKDQAILMLRDELERRAAAQAATKPKEQKNDDDADAQALRIQVARLVKDLYEVRSQRDQALQSNKQEKLSELMNIKNATELRAKMMTMNKALAAQKLRILELEGKMKLNVTDGGAKKKKKQGQKNDFTTTQYYELQSKYKSSVNEVKSFKNHISNMNTKYSNLQQLMNQQIIDHENQIKSNKKKYNKQIMTFEKIIQELKQKMCNKENMIQERNVQILELNTKIQALHDEHDLQYTANVTALEKKLQVAKETTAAETNVIETLRQKMKQNESQNETQKKEVEKLTKQLFHMKQERDEEERRFRGEQSNHLLLQKKHVSLAKEKANQSQIIIRLQQDLILLKEKHMKDIQHQISELIKTQEEKIKELNRLKILDWERAHQSAAESIAKERSTFEQGTIALKQRIVALEQEVKRLAFLLQKEKERYNHAKNDYNNSIKDMKFMLDVANERVHSTEEHVKSMQVLADAEADRLKRAVQQSNDKLMQSQATLNACQKQMIDVQKDCQKEKNISEELRKNLSKVKNEMKLLTLKQGEVTNVQEQHVQQLKKYEAQIISLNARLQKWDKKDQHYQEIEQQLELLQKCVDRNNQYLKESKKKVETLKKEQEQMKEQYQQELLLLTKAHETYVGQLKQEHAQKMKQLQQQLQQLQTDEHKSKKGIDKELEKLRIQFKTQLTTEEKNHLQKLNDLKKEHDNQLKLLQKKMSIMKKKIIEFESEIQRLRTTMAKDLSDALAEKLADKAESMDVDIQKYKKDIRYHKKTIKEQIDRLKKLRDDLKESKERTMGFERNQKDQDAREAKLKNQLHQLKKQKNNNEDDVEKRNEKRNKMIIQMLSELKKNCLGLKDIVTKESKSTGVLSNLSVLIKTAEVSQCEKKVTLLKKELSNNKKVHSVLMYNIKYGEKIIEKFDPSVSKKQKKAREDSLNKLHMDIEESRKKEKRYQETSDDNVDELSSMKKDAQIKLKDVRKERKKMTSSITTMIDDAMNQLKE